LYNGETFFRKRPLKKAAETLIGRRSDKGCFGKIGLSTFCLLGAEFKAYCKRNWIQQNF